VKKLAATAVLILVFGVATAVPAQAHYDPWNTHWHYINGQKTYKSCSWWDGLWGCQTEVVNTGPIVLR